MMYIKIIINDMKKKILIIILIVLLVWLFIRQYNIESYIKKLDNEDAIAELESDDISRNIIHKLCSPIYSHNLKWILLGNCSDIWSNDIETDVSPYESNNETDSHIRWFVKNRDGGLLNVSIGGEVTFIIDSETFQVKGQYYMK